MAILVSKMFPVRTILTANLTFRPSGYQKVFLPESLDRILVPGIGDRECSLSSSSCSASSSRARVSLWNTVQDMMKMVQGSTDQVAR